jgi:hypothetical protein
VPDNPEPDNPEPDVPEPDVPEPDVSEPEARQPALAVNPWAVPPEHRQQRSTSTRIFLGVTVAACAVMGLFVVAGVVLMIAFSGSRFGIM